MIPLQSEEDVVIKSEKFYIKMHMMKELKALILEINNKDFRKTFYGKFKDIDKEFITAFRAGIDNMSPSERLRIIDTLPPIPVFLNGSDASYNLEVNKEQNEDIGNLTKLLNTSAGNITKIMYYLSLPEHLYSEFPYLADHYRVIEFVLNIYLEKIDPEKKLNYYEHIKHLI